jgi:hypothetical protein
VEELEHVLMVEPIIHKLQKKPPAPPPLYKDTDSNTSSKISLSTWHDLYNKIHHDDFPEFMPHSDL